DKRPQKIAIAKATKTSVQTDRNRDLLLLQQIQKLYLNHNYQKLHQIVRWSISSSSDIGQNNAIFHR
ncbi:MAG: hypothetical protein ACJ71P_09225, partial [Nitrososphaeraceae archaeon]